MLEQILSSMIGIIFGSIIGTIIVMIIGNLMFPIMVKRSGKKIVEIFFDTMGDDTKKGKIKQWFEDVIKNGMSEALKDPKIKKAALATLDAIEDRVKKTDK